MLIVHQTPHGAKKKDENTKVILSSVITVVSRTNGFRCAFKEPQRVTGNVTDLEGCRGKSTKAKAKQRNLKHYCSISGKESCWNAFRLPLGGVSDSTAGVTVHSSVLPMQRLSLTSTHRGFCQKKHLVLYKHTLCHFNYRWNNMNHKDLPRSTVTYKQRLPVFGNMLQHFQINKPTLKQCLEHKGFVSWSLNAAC